MRLFMTALLSVALSAAAFALSLDEAVTLTLENDESIKRYQLLTESQLYTKRSALAPFMPSADLGYNASYTKTYDDNDTYDGIKNKAGTFSAELSYNIFNGFNDWYGYQISSTGYDMQELQYTGHMQDIILEVKKAYVSYLQSKNEVEVAEETLLLLETQKNTAEISYQVGQFSRADVLKVDVQLASSRLDLLNAQINVKLAQQQLEKLIGKKISPDEEIVDIELKEYFIPDLDILYDYLEINRSEMHYAQKTYESAEYGRKRSVNTFLPKLNAVASYNWYGDDGYNAFDGREANPYYDEAFIVGVNASWNLFQGLSSYNTYMANAKNAMAASHNVNDTRSSLRLALSDAYETYFSAKERLAVARVGVESAEENYRVTKTQYDNSEATTTDLLDASVALNNARNDLSRAKYDIISTVATLERAVETDFLGLRY